jgi:hypothetical protein
MLMFDGDIGPADGSDMGQRRGRRHHRRHECGDILIRSFHFQIHTEIRIGHMARQSALTRQLENKRPESNPLNNSLRWRREPAFSWSSKTFRLLLSVRL